MITLLADSNALRHIGLKAYLQASRDHAIALSDLTLVEMRKSKALATSRDSVRIAAQFPNQLFVLRRTDQILDENVTCAAATHALFDYDETIQFAALCRRLQTLPPPPSLAEEMAEHEANARLIMSRLADQVAELEPGLVNAARDFTQAELTQIRTVQHIEDSTRRKLLDLLKRTTGNFILQNQDPGQRAPMLLRDAMGLFAFR